MKPTPEKLDMIIKMDRRCASPLPWEVDINRANETIGGLVEALEQIAEPMGAWNNNREIYYKNIIDECIKIAQDALAAVKEAPGPKED